MNPTHSEPLLEQIRLRLDWSKARMAREIRICRKTWYDWVDAKRTKPGVQGRALLDDFFKRPEIEKVVREIGDEEKNHNIRGS